LLDNLAADMESIGFADIMAHRITGKVFH